jgi:hypothetical protein
MSFSINEDKKLNENQDGDSDIKNDIKETRYIKK